MFVERRILFDGARAMSRDGRAVALPCGPARVVSSPLMEIEAVDFDEDGARFELAPGEVGRLIAAGQAGAVQGRGTARRTR